MVNYEALEYNLDQACKAILKTNKVPSIMEVSIDDWTEHSDFFNYYRSRSPLCYSVKKAQAAGRITIHSNVPGCSSVGIIMDAPKAPRMAKIIE